MPRFNEETYLELEENYQGFCTKCEEVTRDNTEPDAEGYDCPHCGQNTVIGAMEYLFLYG